MSTLKNSQHSIDIATLASSSAVTTHHVFYYNADVGSDVNAVSLLGSFNDWDRSGAVPMKVFERKIKLKNRRFY